MATEEDGIRAFAAEPDNIITRKQFDDWLVENGQPLKAEFIRAEYESALSANFLMSFGATPG